MNPLNIIVIEDNMHMSEMIQDFLHMKFSEAKVHVYNTGEEALNASSVHPDLFILDYNLDSHNSKSLNGIQILMKIREKSKTPVIFLSSNDSANIAINTMKYGASDYVVKTSQDAFNRLEIAIKNVLHSMEMEHDLKKQKKFIALLAVVVIVLAVGMIWAKMSS
ncbi:MAG: response regulator [Bacteroidetes bacterium]|mgnify:FL=1|nr:response regulator [Bacteroidota bacterium]MBK6840554.1 response regulator [Bacteroidota bacterium]MBK9523905.1 response regulator [Bacteroidota bacterium]MBK9541646.1 response regulator [Bacteroidota bacterium]MBP6403112.1 response regulator [Bacteroidia bacterium]